MGRPQVGLSSLQGTIDAYAKRFDVVEVRFDTLATAKAATMRAWRRAAKPPFTFSVVLPKIAGTLQDTDEARRALASALDVATTLEARCIVLETGADVRPTKQNRDRVRALLRRMERPSVELCWEPHGVWELPDIVATAKSANALPVLDATKDPLPSGPSVYTRIRALGRSGVSAKALARLAEQLQGRRDAWVIVEDKRAATRVKAELAGALSRAGLGAPPIVVRPSPGRLRAEDEEQ
jgi:uncharacterized protein YecE (DUF72 family)